METCPASGNAPSVYLIEEATGSSPVAPTIHFYCLTIPPPHTTLDKKVPVSISDGLSNSANKLTLSPSYIGRGEYDP